MLLSLLRTTTIAHESILSSLRTYGSIPKFFDQLAFLALISTRRIKHHRLLLQFFFFFCKIFTVPLLYCFNPRFTCHYHFLPGRRDSSRIITDNRRVAPISRASCSGLGKFGRDLSWLGDGVLSLCFCFCFRVSWSCRFAFYERRSRDGREIEAEAESGMGRWRSVPANCCDQYVA